MKTPITSVVLACAALLCGGASAGAQASKSTCRPADEMTTRIVEYFQRVVTPRDSAETKLRDDLGLAGVTAAEVTAVSDPSVCVKAGRAMQRLDETPQPSYALYVVRVGRQFGVVEPTWKAGEYTPALLFDPHWKLRRTLLNF